MDAALGDGRIQRIGGKDTKIFNMRDIEHILDKIKYNMKEEVEIWKPVKDFEGRYEVSNRGRIKSLISTRNGSNDNSFSSKILKPFTSRCGYKRVCLVDQNGKRNYKSIHRIVMSTFKGENQEKNQVNHINGIKTDNRLENLEWVTQSENMLHAYALGLEKPCDNGLKKHITAYKGGVKVGEFISKRGMCRELNLDRRSVERTLKGEYKSHHGLTFVEL